MDYESLKKDLYDNQVKEVKQTLERLGYDPGMCHYRLSESIGIPYKYLDVYFMHLLIRLRVNAEGKVWYDGTYAPIHSPPLVQPFMVKTANISKGGNYAVH